MKRLIIAIIWGLLPTAGKFTKKLREILLNFYTLEPYTQDFSCVSLYKMAIKNTFAPISFVYRKQAHDLIGYYNENLPVLGDWEFNLRFLQKFDIDVIPETLANYHLRVNCNTQEFSNTIFWRGAISACKI
ncbi:MAG: hypothetical protein MZV70_69885 [Desulfobacterales bacterium]|nr:hypothetical protein [Desulfobacterales bacterium]